MLEVKATSKNGKAGWDATGSGTANNEELPTSQSQLPKITLDYLEYGAPEGQRDDSAYKAAQQFCWNKIGIDEATAAIVPRAMADGLSASQAEKCVRQGYQSKPGEPIGRGTQYTRLPARPTAPKFKKIETAPEELPDYIADGDRALMEAAFEPGEFICIGDTFENEQGEISPTRGNSFTREDFLGWLAEKPINKWFTDKNGLFVRINPMRPPTDEEEREARKKGYAIPLDTYVTSFRHALIEADKGDKESQLGALRRIGLPITATIDSAGRSVHAWVRIDASTREEYRERVALLHQFCRESLGLEVDPQNTNPSRYSRMPNGNRMRINKDTGEPVLGEDGKPIIDQQRLLEVNVPGKSWAEWESEVQVEQDSKRSYQRFDLDDLINFRPADDPDCLIGNRWLGKGSTFVLSGEPGHGKSSLALAFLSKWALGEPAFGIDPDRPLKCVVIQAENDRGDMAEPLQGQIDYRRLSETERASLKQNLIILQDYESSGPKFATTLKNIIEDFKPDVVVADPLMTYAGCDLTKTDQVIGFLHNTLSPIIKEAGIIFGFIHHDRKPTAPNGKKPETRAMFNSLGSVVIQAWAREMISLVCTSEKNKQFELHFDKRGKHNGVGAVIRIRHTKQEGVIRWEQMGVMEGTATGPSKALKHHKMEADVLDLLKSKDNNGCVYKADVEYLATKKGYSKKDAWIAAHAIGRDPQSGFHLVPVLNTHVISADPNYGKVDPDADEKKVLAYIKSNVLVTQNMLTKKWNDPAAPPRDDRVKIANSLVDDETVFSDKKAQIYQGRPTSQCWSYGKHPAECQEEIARMNGREIFKDISDDDPFA
jgi:RecA-family ATPase